MREITESGVDVHRAVGVEAGGVQPDPSLEIPVHGDPGRSRVPPVPVDILEGVPVACALNESARLVRDWIVRRIGKWPEWAVPDVRTGCVDVVLRAGRAVLQVIAAGVLRHPGALDERRDRRLPMILAKPLPAMFSRL